jgi:hypothetical protein
MTTDEYCLFAAECISMAQRSRDEQSRAMWLRMADVWTRLAKETASQDLDPQTAKPDEKLSSLWG